MHWRIQFSCNPSLSDRTHSCMGNHRTSLLVTSSRILFLNTLKWEWPLFPMYELCLALHCALCDRLELSLERGLCLGWLSAAIQLASCGAWNCASLWQLWVGEIVWWKLLLPYTFLPVLSGNVTCATVWRPRTPFFFMTTCTYSGSCVSCTIHMEAEEVLVELQLCCTMLYYAKLLCWDDAYDSSSVNPGLVCCVWPPQRIPHSTPTHVSVHSWLGISTVVLFMFSGRNRH